jgi:hypothetical protein
MSYIKDILCCISTTKWPFATPSWSFQKLTFVFFAHTCGVCCLDLISKILHLSRWIIFFKIQIFVSKLYLMSLTCVLSIEILWYLLATLVAFGTTLHLLFDHVLPWVFWNLVVWTMHLLPNGYVMTYTP